jgi:hypothetical protein
VRQARVYNLCDSYAYQTAGYYVSLAAARTRTMLGRDHPDTSSRALLRADDD